MFGIMRLLLTIAILACFAWAWSKMPQIIDEWRGHSDK